MKIKKIASIYTLLLLISMIWTINYAMAPIDKSKSEWQSYKDKQLEIINKTKSPIDIYDLVVTANKTSYLMLHPALEPDGTHKILYSNIDNKTQLTVIYNSCPTLLGSLVFRCTYLTLPSAIKLAKESQANDIIVIKLESSWTTPSGITYSISHRAK